MNIKRKTCDIRAWKTPLLPFCLLSSRLLSKNLKIMRQKTIILPVVLYGCDTWSLTLREEYRLRVFENNIWIQERLNDRRLEQTAQ
jgi:hypothetical protein